MENEIKRLEKNRSVTIVVMLVIMLAIVLSACTVSAGGEPHVKSKSEKAIEQAKTILQGIKSGDAEKIADQFSPIAKEKHPQLENDIKKWMGFLDGEIISYGEPVRDFGDATWDEDGYIIWGGSIEIDNVKTDTGKTYEIVYGVYATVRDHPEYEGVTDLLVIDTKKQEKANMEAGVIAMVIAGTISTIGLIVLIISLIRRHRAKVRGETPKKFGLITGWILFLLPIFVVISFIVYWFV